MAMFNAQDEDGREVEMTFPGMKPIRASLVANVDGVLIVRIIEDPNVPAVFTPGLVTAYEPPLRVEVADAPTSHRLLGAVRGSR